MRGDFERFRGLASRHCDWRGSCVNLIAAENLMSPMVREALSTDFGHRYGSFTGAEAVSAYTSYAGTRYVSEVYNGAAEAARRIFKAGLVDLRPLSGNLADVAVLLALTNPGDRVAITGPEDGGHANYAVENGLCPSLARRYLRLPYDAEEVNIDSDAALKLVEENQPRLIILGASQMLFPQPVRELSDAARSVGAMIAYDAAHMLGLIAGRLFQDPLREGADVMMASTHKSFPGPQGGIILSNNEEVFDRVSRIVYPVLQDNVHYHRVYAMALALSEMEVFAEVYAKQVVSNARALASSLHSRGLSVLGEKRGFTASHIVRVDVSALGGCEGCLSLLEEANIVASPSPLPGGERQGLRLGTLEATRLGMKEEQMDRVAGFIKAVLLEGRDPRMVAEEVASFRRGFQTVKYCFENP